VADMINDTKYGALKVKVINSRKNPVGKMFEAIGKRRTKKIVTKFRRHARAGGHSFLF
jgi:hypothetical protein